jgi:maltooligosyltrehalose trehalohydrolase
VHFHPVLEVTHQSVAESYVPMHPVGRGYFEATAAAPAGSRYTFRVDGDREFPDPASQYQPDGVHEASEVVDHTKFEWSDRDFVPPPLNQYVVYELHVGAFTPEGTLDAAAARLPQLRDLGINAVEVMPLAQFPGSRNWGYDGVYPYAVQSSYGGPDAFRRFVDASHEVGIAVILDVVYNHLGPEGNYCAQYGDYFTDRYRTPWGAAVNVDGSGSDEVRSFFTNNLIHWMDRYHVDAFRLDAVHQIHDESAVPFLSDLSRAVRGFSEASGKPHYIIAESDLNDRRIVAPYDSGGLGLDSSWSDDFHHAVHACLTGERRGYYADFGEVDHVARALTQGWSYAWDYSVHRERRHGNSPTGLPSRAFVFCTQNHDQVGNRMLGERLRALAGVGADRLARSLLLLAPYVPLIFMGQEYGEDRPFLYFVDHGDPELLQATREGRRREFAEFHGAGAIPDPGARETLEHSTLDWESRERGDHADDLRLTRRLLSLRREYDCFRPAPIDGVDPQRSSHVAGQLLVAEFRGERHLGLVVANFSEASRTTTVASPPAAGTKPPAAGVKPPAAGTAPPAAGMEPPAAGMEPPAAGAALPWRRVLALSKPDFGAEEAVPAESETLELGPFDLWAFVRPAR